MRASSPERESSTYSAGKTVVELFESQVSRTPDVCAVQLDQQSISYRELDERANQLAGRLRVAGAGPERLVVLYMERSIEAVCAILAALKAGAACAPGGHVIPEELSAILKNGIQGAMVPGRPPVLVTHARLVNSLPKGMSEVIAFDSDFAQVPPYPSQNLGLGLAPRGLAYVSSTSRPDGELETIFTDHRSLVSYIGWANQQYGEGKPAAWPLFTTLALDLSILPIFAPLVSGGRIVIYPETPEKDEAAILKVLSDGLVDVLKVDSSHVAAILDADPIAARIRTVIVAGGSLKAELARDVAEKLAGHVRIYNEFGPAEVTVGGRVDRHENGIDRGLFHQGSSETPSIPAPARPKPLLFFPSFRWSFEFSLAEADPRFRSVGKSAAGR